MARCSPPATDTIDVLCFCRGTCIRTPAGSVPVEQLAVGDTVVTWSGARRPITWIGEGKLLAAPGNRSAATPVIIRTGAFAPDSPARDLRVTKGHSFLFGDVLIPVEFLVNHRSILWDDRPAEVGVFHIELETHDVLDAEGAPAESYRDDGNRWLFRNANTGWDQSPKTPYAPVVTGGEIVDAVWRRLLARAGSPRAMFLSDEPDLHLLADGVRIDGQRQDDGCHVFFLRQMPATLRIVSRAAAPDRLGYARDPRLLGVALRSVAVWSTSCRRIMAADDDRLTEGFHLFEPENGFRWTDGDAVVPRSLLGDVTGPAYVVVDVAMVARYLAEAAAAQAA